MTFYGEVYLDGRILVNKRNHLGLNYTVKLSELIAALPPSTFAVYTFQNGLTLDASTLTVSWGGTLVNNTLIDGEGFDVTFDDVNIFNIINTQEINFSSLTNVNITAVTDIINNAANIVNVATLDIDNTAGNIYNQVSNEIVSTSVFNQTNAETIEQNGTVSITNTTPLLTNQTDFTVNNATTSIVNTTPLFQTDATTIDENADYITNDATFSIISTAPLIREVADDIKETASNSITNTTPNMYNEISVLYETTNTVFETTCNLDSVYTSGENIGLYYDYTFPTSDLQYYNGQFSFIQGFNNLANYTVSSGLYTFVNDCIPSSVIRTGYKDYTSGDYSGTTGSFDGESIHLYVESEEVGVNQFYNEIKISGTNILVQYQNIFSGEVTTMTTGQNGIDLSGNDIVTGAYNYRLPTTTPNEGDSIYSDNGGILYFAQAETIIESRQVISSPVVGSKFRFTLPFTNQSFKATRLNWFLEANDAGTVEFTISDVQTGSVVLLGTETFNIPPAVPTLTQAGSVTLSNINYVASTHQIWDIEITNITGIPDILELAFSIAFVRN